MDANMPKIRMIAKGEERFFILKIVDRQRYDFARESTTFDNQHPIAF